MMIREPVVAGQFYPGNRNECVEEIEQLLAEEVTPLEANQTPVGGLVPHAGWVCSGTVAAKVFRTLTAAQTPEVIVLFGGVHRYRGKEAAMFARGRWDTPLGAIDIDDRLAERILGHTNVIIDDPYAHEQEHSLEVQVPFVRHVFPRARIVPIMVPISAKADEVGAAVGRTLKAYDYNALIVGTTDLTHYGPRYGFIPHGVGAEGNAWAKERNDVRFIELVCAMRGKELAPEAAARKNACSSGAAAATIGAVEALGATRGILLEHATSSEVLARKFDERQDDSVGYAGVVFV